MKLASKSTLIVLASSVLFTLEMNSKAKAATLADPLGNPLPPIPSEFQSFVNEFGKTAPNPLDYRSVWVGGTNGLAIFTKTGQDTNNQYTQFDYEIPAGSVGASPHIHTRENEWWYVAQGTLQFRMDNDSFTASAGDYVFGPLDHIHGFTNIGTTPGRVLIEWQPSGLENWFFQGSDPVTNPNTPPPHPHLNTLYDSAPEYGIDYLSPPPPYLTEPVPEPSSTFGVLAFGAFGAISFLKRKHKLVSKS